MASPPSTSNELLGQAAAAAAAPSTAPRRLPKRKKPSLASTPSAKHGQRIQTPRGSKKASFGFGASPGDDLDDSPVPRKKLRKSPATPVLDGDGDVVLGDAAAAGRGRPRTPPTPVRSPSPPTPTHRSPSKLDIAPSSGMSQRMGVPLSMPALHGLERILVNGDPVDGEVAAMRGGRRVKSPGAGGTSRLLHVDIPEEDSHNDIIVPLLGSPSVHATREAEQRNAERSRLEALDREETLAGSNYAIATKRNSRRHQQDAFCAVPVIREWKGKSKRVQAVTTAAELAALAAAHASALSPANTGDSSSEDVSPSSATSSASSSSTGTLCPSPGPGSSFFAVCDGHGDSGHDVSRFAALRLGQAAVSDSRFHSPTGAGVPSALVEAFTSADRECLSSVLTDPTQSGGTTAVAMFARACDNRIWVANAGDSRCVLSRNGRAVPLSRDHNPSRKDEKRRIEAAGGHVLYIGTWRVGGVLAVSRAIGDKNFKPFVPSHPDVEEVRLCQSDEFAILASDGLFGVVKNQECVDIVHECADLERAASRLCEVAIERGSRDNITVVVVSLEPYKQGAPAAPTPLPQLAPNEADQVQSFL